MKQLLLSISLGLLVSASVAQSFDVYLLGDAGEPEPTTDPNLSYLGSFLSQGDAEDVLIILGDNLYPKGLPPREHKNRPEMERRLNAQLDLIKNFKGRAFMIPGNHDWISGQSSGWEGIKEMQHYVESYLDDSNVFLPTGGCPGPIEIVLSDKLTLIILDTQYPLHPWEKPDETSSCEQKSTSKMLLELDEVVRKNKNNHVIVAGHHPIYSYGPHNGYYTFRQHLFPLTDLNRKLYIPMPVIGSIYPMYRKLIGARQDLNHPRYKIVRKNMESIFSQCENLVYVSGHEHSLQYIQKNGVHQVISGSGSKSSPVKKGEFTQFAHEGAGFGKLAFQKNDSVSVAFWDGEKQKIIFDKPIYHKKIIPDTTALVDFEFSDSTVTTAISKRYSASSFEKKLLGENYRDLWATPVQMPVFNIGTEHGGLTIKKMGGGNQTRSLRLEASDGRQYVLRTLDKYTDKLLPDALHRTLAADILQDEISAANPYGAFAVPYLAEAAEVYHTNPTFVYIPNDPRFGPYREILAGQTVLYEERPNEEAASESFFGSGEDIISTPDVLEELYDDNDNSVDQHWALKSRLFDNLIADWDRHDDQWRWVEFDKKGKGKYYRPIPRDRDQAFFVNNGLIPWIASRKWALPNSEGFHETIDYPAGFNTSGRFFDRSFLTSLDWNDWEHEIIDLQTKLSDEAIADAFTYWPDTIQKQEAKRTVETLIKRRDNLYNAAREYYLFLSEEVEIVGSNKHEYFLVERLNDKETSVTVRKRKKDGELEQVIYHRVFKTDETREIRLYGLDGEDIFEIKGEVHDGIKVRIIGGSDDDKIIDESHVSGWGHKTQIYDLKKNTTTQAGKESTVHLSDNPSINRYDRTAFKYNKLFPLVSAQFNPDDGIFIGGGFLFSKHGWRKEPFAQQHKLRANLSFATGAFNIYYEGTITDVIGKWDLVTDVTVQRPYGVTNYFGFGNESVYDFKGKDLLFFDDDGEPSDDYIDYYRVRFEHIHVYPSLSRSIGAKGSITIGPEYHGFEIVENDNSFISTPEGGLDQNTIYNTFQYIGWHTEIEADTRNHKQLTTSGVYAKAELIDSYGISSVAGNLSQVSGDFRFYLSAHIPMRITLASRTGASHTTGNFEFFNGSALGRETLRGYRRTRFVGNSSFYNNVDLRLKLFSFRTYLFPGSVGLVGYHDIGRVWYSGEDSNSWHSTVGGGVWVAPLNQWVLVFNMSFTEEENLPSVTMGFQF